MTTREYEFPDVGEGTVEGELLQWYVEEGDDVSEDQVIAEVETDKAVVDIPSPVDGTVLELRYAEGDVIPVGEIFVVFEVDGDGSAAAEPAGPPVEDTPEAPVESDRPGASESETEPAASGTGASDPAPTPAGRAFAPPTVRRLARELGVDLETVSGSGASGRITEADVQAASGATGATGGASATSHSEPTAQAPTEPVSESRPSSTDAVAASRDRTLAQPTTRRVAHELDVDINAVPEVKERDGESFVTADAVREFAAAETGEAGPSPAGPGESPSAAAGDRVPYRGVRRTIGRQMERSKFTIPHVTTVDEVDVTELVDLRERLAEPAADRGTKLTYLSFAVKAVGTALQEFPYINASLDTDNEEIVLKDSYNVGIATESEDGLRVPVVDDVDQKGLRQVAEDVASVTRRAQEGTITREEMQGGTFTISNIGPYGGEHGTPIINHPEVAIIAIGRVKEKPRVVDGDIVARDVLHLSMSFDHRIVDGAMATQFLNRVKEQLEKPELFLLGEGSSQGQSLTQEGG